MLQDDGYAISRSLMVNYIEQYGGITNPYVLDAMATIPRHAFVAKRHRHRAYHHVSLPIGEKQITLPSVVTAFMLQALALTGTENILEVGTGSGYLSAVLEHLGGTVFSLERSPILADSAANRLHRLGFKKTDVHLGDGSQGLPDMAPFDAIIVTATAPSLPKPLGTQLHPNGGRMIIPVGNGKMQDLHLITRYGDQWQRHILRRIQTTQLIGRYGFNRNESPKAGV